MKSNAGSPLSFDKLSSLWSHEVLRIYIPFFFLSTLGKKLCVHIIESAKLHFLQNLQ